MISSGTALEGNTTAAPPGSLQDANDDEKSVLGNV